MVTTPMNQGPPAQTNPATNNINGSGSQETLQALLAMLNNSAPTNNQEDQASYVGIYEGDKSLFLPADRQSRQKPISGTSILRKKNGVQNQDDTTGLGETEGLLILDIDVVMED
ncbi:5149_t:CDS:1, partial [Scutellospora calospora]